ncbi:MAG TPA: amidohydrolase family protein [Planctomycetota bacterium]|nr:amidohydrolase family protein [Planctomycetota bacterium]
MRAPAWLFAWCCAASAAAQVVVQADTLYTGAGPAIRDGVVVIEGGKVTAVGPAATTPAPGSLPVLRCAVATPGLVDAHSVVGLAGHLNQPHDQDQLERSTAIQPELRAIDAFNAREKLVGWLRSFGITTVHTGHAPGILVSGQTMVVKTTGRGADQDVLVPCAMIACTLGEQATTGDGPSTPRTRSKAVAMLRAALLEAQEYARKRALEDESKRPAQDLKLEALARVLRREVPLLVTANREHDISAALRLAREFDLRIVLDGAAESYLILPEIAAAGVPVIPHPPMARTSGALKNATMELPRLLADAGIPFAMQSGYESYVPKTRVVLFEAAIAMREGLAYERALAAITLDAARLLGVDARVGSLEPGKDGDVALFDGDPFEYTTHCIATVIDGVVHGK